MSDVEAWRGKLTPVDTQGKTIDQWIQEKLGETELPNYCDTWIEYLAEEHNQEFHYDAVREILFAIDATELNPENFTVMENNGDGTYSFVTCFYNGGTFLNEVLQDGLDNM